MCPLELGPLVLADADVVLDGSNLDCASDSLQLGERKDVSFSFIQVEMCS